MFIETNNTTKANTMNNPWITPEVKTAVKEDAVQAAQVATLVTVIVTALEVPIVLVYLAIKWTTAFVGAVMGILGVKLAIWAWNKYKAKKAK